MNKFEKAIEELCYELDMSVYLPVKQELSGINVPYSLGLRKERFKQKIQEIIEKLQDEKMEINKLYKIWNKENKSDKKAIFKCDACSNELTCDIYIFENKEYVDKIYVDCCNFWKT